MKPEPIIVVANVKNGRIPGEFLHLYCGRSTSKHPEWMTNANTGNPHPVGRVCPICKVVHQQDEAADAYIDQRDNISRQVERMAQRIKEGKSIALYCFCSPKKCHADTIKQMVLDHLA